MKKYIAYLIIAIVYLFTAVNSTGYHHPDEHFQLIEFAGLKAGWNTAADLTWEYDTQMRPSLQPIIALGVIKVFTACGITSPFDLTLVLRLLTAVLAFCSISFFARSFQSLVKQEYRLVFFLLSFLLWFLPAINVRFSSETWAGLVLLPPIAILNKKEIKPTLYILAGLFLGLSFEFRYQMGISVVALFLWLILIKKEGLQNLLYFVSGILFVVIVCTFLDSWFYGDFVIAPWNYFQNNIVNDAASHFGISPWYYYLMVMIERPTPLLGILILAALLLCCTLYYKNPIVWCVVPFILIHSFIPHKEVRFLFPMVNLFPIILILAFQYIISSWNALTVKAIVWPLLGILFLINAGGLVMMSFKPAMCGRVEMIKYLQERQKEEADTINLYSIDRSNPYMEGTWKGLTARFYLNDRIVQHDLYNKIHSKEQKKYQNNDIIILLAGHEERSYVRSLGFQVEYQSVPLWIEKMNIFYKVYSTWKTLLLYSKKE